jgi:site-specific recombinase XerD
MNAPSTVPVITIFVRHSKDCKYYGDEISKRCNCRKHLRWTTNGVQHRCSAKTRSWAEAERQKQYLIEQMSAGNAPVPASASPTVRELVDVFVMAKESQRIGATTVKRHKRELTRLADFFEANGVFVPSAITGTLLYKFRDRWPTIYPASSTQREAQQRIRQFLRFLHDEGYLQKLPRLSPIKVDQEPTMPLDTEQYKKLLDTIPKVFEHEGLAQRIRAVVRLMRHSGLAIGDAVTLKRDALVLVDKKKKLYRVVTNRQKTGTHVSVIIPADVALELLSVTNGNIEYIFWENRGGQKKTVAKDYQKDFRRLFVAAGLGNFSSHSLRDTFSVDLLERGVPLEEVSKLLGHTSTKITEHYAPWIKGRQDRLDSIMIEIVGGAKNRAAA